MPERNKAQELYQRRIKECPIHQLINVDEYLENVKIPKRLRRPFHEIVFARGEKSKIMSDEEGREFWERVEDIGENHDLNHLDSTVLIMMYTEMIRRNPVQIDEGGS